MESDNIKRVFVLGAGASKHCGYPLTNELLKEITLRLNTHSEDTEVKEDRGQIDSLVGALYPDFYLSNTYPNIEDVLSLIEASKDIGSKISELKYRFYIEQSEDIYKVKRIILRNIYDYFFEKLETVSNDKAIFEFADCLKPNDVVISFNWDLNLEKALEYLRKDYMYSLYDRKGDKIVILKPHGSMNWFNRKEIQLKSDRIKPLIEGFDNIGVFVFEYLRPLDTFKKDFIPQIVPPIIQKEIEQELIEIWKNIYYALSTTQEINILGYSLPSNDLYPRYVFRMAIWHNKHFQTADRIGRQFLLANPDCCVYQTYRNLVGYPVRFEPIKFEELKFKQLFM